MAIRLISLFLIVSFIYACAPKPKSYESATKWHVECNPLYPEYHPGDYIKAKDDFEIAIKEGGCVSECRKKYVCSEGRGYASCVQNTNSCIKSCYQEILNAHSIAYHIEGGHYSDGSYFARCQPFNFTNIHPTADKYKKTEWQTDRDDCMKLTSENVKPSYWVSGVGVFSTVRVFVIRTNGYYINCLKERGYLNYINIPSK